MTCETCGGEGGFVALDRAGGDPMDVNPVWEDCPDCQKPDPVVYLAARYTRREELNGYADQLREIGYSVDARWLLGEHQVHEGGDKIDGLQNIPDEAIPFARDDVEDVLRADFVVSFTEPPRSNNSRGGRHVEFGMALASGKNLIVVGPRENIFHALPDVHRFNYWEEAFGYLKAVKS